MNAVIPPTLASRDHIAVLEYFCDEQARRRPALRDIFAALRSNITLLSEDQWAAPTFQVIHHHFSRAVRRAQILAKRDEAVNQARQAFIRAAYPKITALSTNGFQGLHGLTSQRIAEAAEEDKKIAPDEVVDFIAADEKAKAERAAKRAHAYFLAAPRRKKKAVNDENLEEIKGRLLAEVNEWKKTSAAAGAALKKQTVKEYAAQVSSRPGFPHSQPMPRLRINFCAECSEQVVVPNNVLRPRRGLYLPVEHECGVHVVDGVPSVKKQSVTKKPAKFRSEEAAQKHFENTLTFVGDGVELEAIDSFKHNPRANHSDQREKDLMRRAQRSPVAIAVGPTCPRCTTPITKRKGTKFCSENCRKRHHEATQGEN